MNKYLVYIEKCNLNQENQIILLIIPKVEGRYYLTVKKMSTLLTVITSKHNSDFYYLYCLHYFREKSILELHENVSENKDF